MRTLHYYSLRQSKAKFLCTAILQQSGYANSYVQQKNSQAQTENEIVFMSHWDSCFECFEYAKKFQTLHQKWKKDELSVTYQHKKDSILSIK